MADARTYQVQVCEDSGSSTGSCGGGHGAHSLAPQIPKRPPNSVTKPTKPGDCTGRALHVSVCAPPQGVMLCP